MVKIKEYEKMLDEILDRKKQHSDDFTARRLANLMTVIERENQGLTQVIERQDEVTEIYLKVRAERDVYLFDE